MSSIVTITGPSCAGKSTLETILKGLGFASIISTTTRPKRLGEVDGESYYFMTPAAFALAKEEGQFIESIEFNGNLYGVSVEEVNRVLAMGKPIVLIVEPHGLIQMRQYAQAHDLDLYSYFITNPADVIAKRFLARFAQQIVNVRSNVDAVLDNYYPRLAVMMEEERDWINVTDDGEGIYDLILPSFNEGNLDKITQDIATKFLNTESVAV